MKLTFLGTGTSQGVPVIGCSCPVCISLDFRDKRFRSAISIQVDGKTFVVDTGPDFRQQMLREKISRLDAVLFTHAHRDHTAGLDDVRAYNFMQNMDMPVYGTNQVLEQLKLEYSYVFSEVTYPGIPRLQLFRLTAEPLDICGVPVVPLPVMHHKLPVMGFRFGDISYITDANFIPDETVERMRGTEVLVINALQYEPHVSHFTVDEALREVKRIKPKKTYFTHISHKLGQHADVSKKLPANISLAWDGLSINL